MIGRHLRCLTLAIIAALLTSSTVAVAQDRQERFYRVANLTHVPGDLTVSINGAARPSPYPAGSTMRLSRTTTGKITFAGAHPEAGEAGEGIALPADHLTTIFFYADVKRNSKGEISKAELKVASVSQKIDEDAESEITVINLSESPELTAEVEGKPVKLLRSEPVKIPLKAGYKIDQGKTSIAKGKVGDRGAALVLIYDDADGKPTASVFE